MDQKPELLWLPVGTAEIKMGELQTLVLIPLKKWLERIECANVSCCLELNEANKVTRVQLTYTGQVDQMRILRRWHHELIYHFETKKRNGK